MSNVPHCKIIEDMLNTEEEIAKATQLTLEEVKELKEQASAVTA